VDVPLIRTRINHLEDVGDAVRQAGLSAFQLSREAPSGSLVHAAHDGVALSTGQFHSRVHIRGPLSNEAVSIGVGLRIPPRNRLLMRDIDTGIVILFRPGDEHEAFHDVNSLYAVISLSDEVLEREAERHGLSFSANAFQRTGIHPQLMARTHLTTISDCLTRLHQADDQARLDSAALADIVASLIGHFSHRPTPSTLRPLRQRERIVELTRTHIDETLDQPLDIEGLARRAGVSRRTLSRSFEETLGESPGSYIARMRLHRIRSDLLAMDLRDATIANVANQWGVSDLGRMSARYRDLFGELPSHTRLRRAQ
jgi:AraC-like DNA-binding protein